MKVTPKSDGFGAVVTGIDLTRPLTNQQVSDLRAVWLEHQVVIFPDHAMSDDDLERFTLYFGAFGDDPFIAPIKGRDHIIAVQRAADETAPVFAENWHTDWSFQENPPAGTCLFGITIPPNGGDTLFANQHWALEKMPDALRQKLEGVDAIHSARVPYAPGGVYGEQDAKHRSMDIRASDDAMVEQRHPIIRAHPETGREAIYGCIGYVTGIADMDQAEGMALLAELYAWQTREEFQYRHKWQEKMLVMWDNRSVLHMATGGYDGFARKLHRTTIAAWDGR